MATNLEKKVQIEFISRVGMACLLSLPCSAPLLPPNTAEISVPFLSLFLDFKLQYLPPQLG
jgi:hypothetical protein